LPALVLLRKPLFRLAKRQLPRTLNKRKTYDIIKVSVPPSMAALLAFFTKNIGGFK
jgi:hypothetical protein